MLLEGGDPLLPRWQGERDDFFYEVRGPITVRKVVGDEHQVYGVDPAKGPALVKPSKINGN